MKIVVINKMITDIHKEQIRKAASEIGGEVFFARSEDEIPSEWEDCGIMYGFGMDNAKKNKDLKWLAVPSAGVDFLMKPGVFANEDCLITNSTGAYGVTIAEHIITVSLMMMRKLDYSYRESLKRNWTGPQMQKSLKDCRITVLGTGDIGCCFAKRARAFEPLSITGVSRSGKCAMFDFDDMKQVSELDSVLPYTDLLVMSLPDTPETRDILNRERLSLLPDGAYVVNVGRGSAIDEEALMECLNEGRLGGAALDVFKTEPLPSDSPLWDTKNLLITPHVAGNLTLEHTLNVNVDMFCDNLVRYGRGLPLKNLIDKNKGY